MTPRVHFITLATPDLAAARAFYRDGLGWSPLLDVPGEIVFFQVGHGLVLGLFDADRFVGDIAGAVADTSLGGLTLSHNLDSPEEVDETVARLAALGAAVVKPPQTADFGGYHGHVRDPNGVTWEICHNPGWSIRADGTVRLGPVDADDEA
ncbi:hypothetical protein LX16_2499 [Stackebrandtia albiflava]|uniref:VOC domain-containing protein n=1 Tax=Stackebrandtia albiflava TaxID=406432 RepID=A0A562V1P1_9ACTN|nr:VOC family protein [Stackebrandtia albiflava]TWJ11765.1 hypothetical protein LX16_2499 [Stackebrandtia albiflava]